MSYLVLARKLRPKCFQDLVGQETIWQTLLNAISTDRVAHAFLFTGPRGVGKTSCARILTKALNCLNPVNNEPCNECVNCKEISANIAPDVLEIDAASNRGIEHIRELRDNVKFSPARCKIKTYIIDEVHMLTIESFNALLKTLEEPPEHVKFILATTDPHKIPATVISRCQRYDFVRIPQTKMVNYLSEVAVNEGIEISEQSLALIARTATGGMRDALTALDMLISYSGTKIDDSNVQQVLGLSDSVEVEKMLSFIINSDLEQAIKTLNSLISKGVSLSGLVTDLMSVVKNLTMMHSLSSEDPYWRDFLPVQLENYRKLTAKTTTGTLQQYFHLLLEMEGQIRRSSQARICMEMGLIKMCRVESLVGVSTLISQLREAGKKKRFPASITTSNSKSTGTTNPRALLNKKGFNQKSLSPGSDSSYAANNVDRVITQNSAPLVKEIKSAKNDTTNPNRGTVENKGTDIFGGQPDLGSPPVGRFEDIPPIGDEIGSSSSLSVTKPVVTNPAMSPVLEESDANKMKRWRWFVEEVSKISPGSLVSILNNAELLELNDKLLKIGSHGKKQLFSLLNDEKKRIVERTAARCFNSQIKVEFVIDESAGGSSIREIEDDAELIRKEKLREEAKSDGKVLDVLSIFSGSEIKEIIIKDKK